ncbi:permease-like cell division protein FtsX [Aquihabitans sp. G128]|uniref:cell division protein FtsX n=1 Tax=Aquihabitans sp. G128 TaxID=2849779 RepID=UPI001C23CDCD|nr:permease-like cell division protein FtsX [Aquihabitans sp. G128]QXC62783.1 permease-like cell division protein FtsX [Aquihabitans sp. G128]
MALNGNYVVRETTANLTRNITLTVASILTVFVSLAIVGTTVLMRQGAQNATSRFEGGVEFIVYVNADSSAEQIKAVETSLDKNPGIKKTTYVDADETYADFKRLFAGQDAMLRNVRKADLPTSFKVEPVNKDAATISDLVRTYRKEPNVYDVVAAVEVVREMKGITNFVNNGLTFFAVFLLLASGLLILNTIRTAMFARRREIEVMKLVGATNWFIRIPFMLEGLVQGLVGGGLAVGWVFIARHLIDDLLGKSSNLKLLQNFSIASGDVAWACTIVVGVAVLLSVISSALATRRFLDV